MTLIRHSGLPNCSESYHIVFKTNYTGRCLMAEKRLGNSLKSFYFLIFKKKCRHNGANEMRIGLSNQVCNPDTLETSSFSLSA